MTSQLSFEFKFGNVVCDYMIKKYENDEKDLSIEETQEEEYDEFTQEIFNTELDEDFNEFLNEKFKCTANDIVELLNYSNKYLEDNFGVEQTLRGELTTKKIINMFGYCYMREHYDSLLEFITEYDVDYTEEEYENFKF